jgi:putative spermidine/putrescine transport system ATP-binding protein
LLDEPLGALDLKLREEMQVELKTIQREVGITFVFVTHDQGESLSMSSRIAVFNEGRIEQVGTPHDLYQRPSTSFVANFVGTSNMLSAEMSQRLFGIAELHTVRPERVRVLAANGDSAPGDIVVAGAVSDVQYLGSESRVRVRIESGEVLTASVANDGVITVAAGDAVRLAWPRAAAFAVHESSKQINNAVVDGNQGENT